MLFNSFQFLIFFPIVVLIYYLIPNRFKYIWLLIASYYFYTCWNVKYAFLLLGSTVITYASGILLDRINNSDRDEIGKTRHRKMTVALSFVLNLSILFFFKYFNYTADLITYGFRRIGIEPNIPAFDIILPVGISFYTFQALSYTMDVYRGEINCEKNFLRYALFVSFFPQLVAGPIERSKNLLAQLKSPKPFDFEKARDGFLLMLWGYFLKLIVADRIAIFVDTVYGDYKTYGGWYVMVATVLFAIQIYCDFAGYSTIAMGAAEILGIKLMQNFDAPYLTTSVVGFWRRWHISLTSWFKDYLYIPLGGDRRGPVRKQINKMIVFIVSGIWHGANLTFVIWGALNGLYQVIGDVLMPLRNRLADILHLNTDSYGHKLLRCVATFAMVDFAWIFFRADGFSDAIGLMDSIIHIRNPWILVDGSLYNCGLDSANFNFMIITIMIILLVDFLKTRGIVVRNVIARQDYWFRWAVIIFGICFILIFGIWGSGYDETRFIYFQF